MPVLQKAFSMKLEELRRRFRPGAIIRAVVLSPECSCVVLQYAMPIPETIANQGHIRTGPHHDVSCDFFRERAQCTCIGLRGTPGKKHEDDCWRAWNERLCTCPTDQLTEGDSKRRGPHHRDECPLGLSPAMIDQDGFTTSTGEP